MSTSSGRATNGSQILTAFQVFFTYILANVNRTFRVNGTGDVICNSLDAAESITGDQYANQNNTFQVDANGNLICTTVNATGGNINCTTLTATGQIQGGSLRNTGGSFAVNSSGVVTSNAINATGTITASGTPTAPCFQNTNGSFSVDQDGTLFSNIIATPGGLFNVNSAGNGAANNMAITKVSTNNLVIVGLPSIQPMAWGSVAWNGTTFTLSAGSTNITFYATGGGTPICGIKYTGVSYSPIPGTIIQPLNLAYAQIQQAGTLNPFYVVAGTGIIVAGVATNVAFQTFGAGGVAAGANFVFIYY